jgi:hypothetical protein
MNPGHAIGPRGTAVRERAATGFRAGRMAVLCGVLSVLCAGRAAAAGWPGIVVDERAPRTPPAWRVSFAEPPPAPVRMCCASVRFDLDVEAAPAATRDLEGQGQPRPRAFVYSDAYQARAKVHRLASWAMLPLFGAEAVIGQKMFNDPSKALGGLRQWHRGIAYAIGGLFGVNTLTGTWNLIESRKDPNAGMRRVIHAVLMMVADGGFLATALTRPKNKTAADVAIYDAKKNQHMALAYASVSVATVGYLIMLFK